ncbi:MAG: hypothetical protein A4S09_13125 [Proteobacteria bacterium SG_bin7]|nr:MAG: hypothetical protein A4S09_13125 [Proteobacteria bacterium SG_bin7]
MLTKSITKPLCGADKVAKLLKRARTFRVELFGHVLKKFLWRGLSQKFKPRALEITLVSIGYASKFKA